MNTLATETRPLSIAGIRRRLRAPVVGRQLYLCGKVASTNATLSRLARSGAPEGTVVIAEAQTAGRGRLGQPWFSPPDVNLYASVLLRGPLALREAPVFSLIAGLALAEAVRDAGATPAIKWPNDVLVDSRKVGASLIECAARGDDVEYLILGVGANLNVDLDSLGAALRPAAADATSLRAATGREVDREAFAAAYLNALDAWVRRYRAEGPSAVLEGWRRLDILTDRRVEIRGGDSRFVGRVAGVDPSGRLVVQDALGERRTVLTEEILPYD
jgi:BirA family transcriptional regulator, biotin operon repressor / biotin---[acetyl-CoA-carboxylase] ligase